LRSSAVPEDGRYGDGLVGVLDLAARTGRQWVRRGTTEAGLVRYYRDVQGWDVVREKEHKGFLFTGMARRAQVQAGLPGPRDRRGDLTPGGSGE